MVGIDQSQEPPALETFKIRYKDGAQDYVRAFTIQFPVTGLGLITFFESAAAQNARLFLSASEVASVIPYSSMVDAPPIIEIEGRLSILTSRVDSLENNLATLITAAVNAAFAQRGL